MNAPSELDHLIDIHIGCFGQFNLNDPVCKFRCAASIRCSIARDHIARTEMIEDIISVEMYADRLQ